MIANKDITLDVVNYGRQHFRCGFKAAVDHLIKKYNDTHPDIADELGAIKIGNPVPGYSDPYEIMTNPFETTDVPEMKFKAE